MKFTTISAALAITLGYGVLASPIDKRAVPSYTSRFQTLYSQIHNSTNGYFSSLGIPYHSVETLMCEAPDYGHESTSEAFSYYIWLEAAITGDWSGFNTAWGILEKYLIPSDTDQPTNSFYNPSSPASLSLESDNISDYPSAYLNVPVGQDPLAAELKSAYGTSDIYGAHWLLDVDNWYGFGHCGDGTTKPSYFNTFQRGPSESVWKTVPQPACETFTWGSNDGTGYLSLFTPPSYAKQWKYTTAPDADARSIQAAYWANVWATAQGKASDVAATVAKASKLGDYLRYSFFDKYFKVMDCQSPSCAGGTGKTSAHYLLSWYYAFGGSLATSGGWAWRIGSSYAHFGYQNPLTAWVLSTQSAFKPASPTGAGDWATSLGRQIEFYQWLQSAEGAIAGGATNSWQGAYGAYPTGTPTFYGMGYDWEPVYHDPPSNQWFGMQAWSMERVAEYYYVSGDTKVATLLNNWIGWVKKVVTLTSDGLNWTGQPETWNPTSPAANANLHVVVTAQSGPPDLGVAAAVAKALAYYGVKASDTAATTLAQQLLDRILGIAAPETRADYSQFNDQLTVPSGWSGKMPNGDVIDSSSTFLSIRSKYKSDPNFAKVQTYLNGGAAPVLTYHRFWAQADIAIAHAVIDILLNNSTTTTTTTGTATSTSTPTTTTKASTTTTTTTTTTKSSTTTTTS
ncbi:glycoside hydrolase family protein 48 [Umbelopsis sp. PMI_123]|nr:glycoside hydrolase family protein 48 [Umbelopsis sp. PMI_123]